MFENFVILIFISFILIFALTKVSYNYKFVDIPTLRKKHLKPTAFTGGISLGFCLLLALKIFSINIADLNAILAYGFLLSIVGFIDDKYNLNTGSKLSLQIFPIFLLILENEIFLSSLGSYNFYSLELGSIAIPFSLLCVLFLINSFNYFDGLDGTLSLTSLSVLAILYFLNSNKIVELYLIIVSTCIIIFLFFNFSILNLPKLFLGDSGSLLIGFILSFTLIYFAKEKICHPILLAWSVSLFVYEFLSVNLERLRTKRNVFTAGSDHLHNFLFNKTRSLFFTNFYILNLNLLFFTIGYFSFNYINSTVSLFLFIMFFFIFFFLRKKIR